jgi:hypothetical protein
MLFHVCGQNHVNDLLSENLTGLQNEGRMNVASSYDFKLHGAFGK